MLSSLLRPKKNRRQSEEDTLFSPPYAERRHATADFTETDGEDEMTDEEDGDHGEEGDDEEEEEEEIDEEDGEEDTPLLPIFSSAHLGIFFPSIDEPLLTI